MIFRLNRSKPQDTHALSDLEIVAAYKETEDAELVGELFERYTHWIFGVCFKYLKEHSAAEDAVIQIFEKLLTDLKKYEIQHFRGWLHQVARNHCLMILRKQKHTTTSLDDVEWEPSEHPFEEQEGKQQEAQLTQLEAGISQLGAEQKRCIELFFLQEKSYKEIEELTGFTNKQVKSYIQNGRRNLKKWMGVLPMLIAVVIAIRY